MKALSGFLIEKRVGGKERDAEALEEGGDLLSDAAEAEEADGLAAEFAKRRVVPDAGADLAVARGRLAEDGKHEHQRVFRDGLVVPDDAEQDAAFADHVQVEIVQTDAETEDQTEIFRAADEVAGVALGACDDCEGVLCEVLHFRVGELAARQIRRDTEARIFQFLRGFFAHEGGEGAEGEDYKRPVGERIGP